MALVATTCHFTLDTINATDPISARKMFKYGGIKANPCPYVQNRPYLRDYLTKSYPVPIWCLIESADPTLHVEQDDLRIC